MNNVPKQKTMILNLRSIEESATGCSTLEQINEFLSDGWKVDSVTAISVSGNKDVKSGMAIVYVLECRSAQDSAQLFTVDPK